MIAWFVRNGVAANFMMLVIIVSGILSLQGIKRELFPEFSLDQIKITVPYPGSAPEEVEEGICIRIEEKIQDLEGIKKITSSAQEGSGSVVVEVERGYRPRDLLYDIKSRVDAIDTFPEEAEEPIIEEQLPSQEVLSVAISGEMDEKTLKRLADRLRDQIVTLPGITQAKVGGVRDFEIAIEISEEALRRYGLQFDDVVRAVRKGSLDLPGGTIRASGGEILLRSKRQAYYGKDFESLPVITREDGTRVAIKDIATVVDGFKDEPLITSFNGKPAAVIRVFEVGDQNPLEISRTVTDYLETIKPHLPEGVDLTQWRDSSFYLLGRLELLVKNGAMGLLLVFGVLALFLRTSLAIWVSLGIPISFLGAFSLMPIADVSINLISLFGLILVLGIVVDDAIVIGESVFSHFQEKGPSPKAAIEGTQAVAMPVTFAVITTAVAFVPVLFIPGFLGKIFRPIPIVVLFTLLTSLIESKLILPYHLSLCKVGGGERENLGLLRRWQRASADGLERFVIRVYRPLLKRVLKRPYLTLSCFIGAFILAIGFTVGGWIKFVFFPDVPSDYIVVRLRMLPGTPFAETKRALGKIDRGLESTIESLKHQGIAFPLENKMITVGAQPFSGGPGAIGATKTNTHIGEVTVELIKSEDRGITAPQFAEHWRNAVGSILGAEELSFHGTAVNPQGSPIDVQLKGRDFDALKSAAEVLKTKLSTYSELFDITDTYSRGKKELKLKIKPSAELLGLTQLDLARQVRQAFYGEEAQRVQRGRHDIRVMVRYPEHQRQSLATLETMRVRSPEGTEIPFAEVAEVLRGTGSTVISRIDRQRVVNITAKADKKTAAIEAIKSDLEKYLPELLSRYPGISWSFEGETREQAESLSSLGRGFISILCVIYALMAILFRSYIQPLIIMSVIPFGLIGALLGHLILLRPFSILSILGALALTGVVINDSLVLVDLVNRKRRAGVPLIEAVWEAGATRFRPIFLTSLTTFVGLSPMILETSLQAQFLIPMAISLGFGILFATFITLLLVPACYLMIEDI